MLKKKSQINAASSSLMEQPNTETPPPMGEQVTTIEVVREQLDELFTTITNLRVTYETTQLFWDYFGRDEPKAHFLTNGYVTYSSLFSMVFDSLNREVKDLESFYENMDCIVNQEESDGIEPDSTRADELGAAAPASASTAPMGGTESPIKRLEKALHEHTENQLINRIMETEVKGEFSSKAIFDMHDMYMSEGGYYPLFLFKLGYAQAIYDTRLRTPDNTKQRGKTNEKNL